MRATRTKLGDGKKTKAWTNARRKLKLIFFQMGIQRCEANLQDCMGTDGLGFAHLQKRRNLEAEDLGDPNKVAFLCNHCHWQFEKHGEEKMTPALQKLIDDRSNRLAEAA